MKTIITNVTFTGTVAVSVPDHLNDADAKLLAEKLALSRVVATCDNPGASDEDAFNEYKTQCSKGARKKAKKDWDNSTTNGVSGAWNPPDDDPLCYFRCDNCGHLDTAPTSDVKEVGHPMCPTCTDREMDEVTEADYEEFEAQEEEK